MKRFCAVSCAILLLAGCGSRQSASGKEGRTIAGQKDYISQGVAYLQQSNPRAAIKSFSDAIRQNPADPRAYIILGETYIRLKRYDLAIETFSAATRVIPTDGHLYYLLAVSYNLSGDMVQARVNAEKSAILFERIKDTESLKRSVSLLNGLKTAQ